MTFRFLCNKCKLEFEVFNPDRVICPCCNEVCYPSNFTFKDECLSGNCKLGGDNDY